MCAFFFIDSEKRTVLHDNPIFETKIIIAIYVFVKLKRNGKILCNKEVNSPLSVHGLMSIIKKNNNNL